MEKIRAYIELLKKKFIELDANKKILFIIGLAAVLGVMVTGTMWAFHTNYSYLYTNLGPLEIGQITTKLEGEKIPYKLSAGGSAVMVPDKSLYSARIKLAADGLPNSRHIGFEIFDNTNLGMTDFVQKINYRRALEGELAKSIEELDPVKEARIHLVIPEHKLFSNEQKEPSASIVVLLESGDELSKAQVRGIRHLVASSVEGLKASKITIVDQLGNMLTPEDSDDSFAAVSSRQEELKRNVEKYLENKAVDMLESVVGKNHAKVKITADLNFDKVQRNVESYDPDKVAVRSEETTTEKGSNKTGSTQANETNAENNSKETVVTNYEVSKTMETIIKGSGSIKRLSIAVMVDGTYEPAPKDKNADANGMKYVPRSREELDRLANIVKRTVGFTPDRGDKINVENIKFDNSEEIARREEIKNIKWREWIDIGFSVFLKLASIFLALLILKKSLKRFKEYRKQRLVMTQKAKEVEETSALSREIRKPKLLDQIKVAADENPEEMAKVIKTILLEE